MRRRAYTGVGLRRVPCAHCGEPASEQWSLRPCAIGTTGWYPLCTDCDVELNRVVMEFLRLPDAEERLARYVASRP
jgi:hypothetical protein